MSVAVGDGLPRQAFELTCGFNPALSSARLALARSRTIGALRGACFVPGRWRLGPGHTNSCARNRCFPALVGWTAPPSGDPLHARRIIPAFLRYLAGEEGRQNPACH